MLHDNTKSHCMPHHSSISMRGMNESVVFFLRIEQTTKPYLGHRHLADTLLPSPRQVNHILWMLFCCSTKLSGGREWKQWHELSARLVTVRTSGSCPRAAGVGQRRQWKSQKDPRIFNKEAEMSLISPQGAGQSLGRGGGEQGPS